MARRRVTSRSVFINCPFDPTYRQIFDALVFCVCALDFEPRCALEQDSGTQERLTKILNLIEECRFCIHDLSYMKIDPRTRLPRHWLRHGRTVRARQLIRKLLSTEIAYADASNRNIVMLALCS
jgi:hypothetical protein